MLLEKVFHTIKDFRRFFQFAQIGQMEEDVLSIKGGVAGQYAFGIHPVARARSEGLHDEEVLGRAAGQE